MPDRTVPRMRWWGWGVDGHDAALPPAAERLLADELGVLPSDPRRPPVPLADVVLPAPVLPASTRERLAAVVGDEHVRDDHLVRVTHAVGKSYPDLVRVRSGRVDVAPDAVVFPADAAAVAAVLAVCAEDGVAVVPFGGGTSVVGGVEALRGPFAASVSLDLARLDTLTDVDPVSQVATFGAGLLGPEAERRLGDRGLTLGHFPQSFEFSTVGGWVATRSAGQASTGYGRVDELVVSLEAATPTGVVGTRTVPATAAGPDLRQLLVGSEGTLGVITEATLRVRPAPEARRYEAWSFPSFEAGTEALRLLEQGGSAPDVARLSDADETRLSLATAPAAAATALRGYLRVRGHRRPCLTVVGFEGPEAAVPARRAAAAAVLRAAGGVPLGRRPGDSWVAHRFSGPYLRDELLSRGVLVDTLETATTWTRLPTLYGAVRGALRDTLEARGTPAAVMCHVSHVYATGASLYLTYLARQEEGAELEQWYAAKAAAGDAIAAAGGTITHHHAVGRDHAPWLPGEVGELGVQVLRAAKAVLDPVGVLNPGKLVDGLPLPGAPATP